MEDWENELLDFTWDFAAYLRKQKAFYGTQLMLRLKEKHLVFGKVKGVNNHKYNQRKVLGQVKKRSDPILEECYSYDSQAEDQGDEPHKLSGDFPAQPKATQTESQTPCPMKRIEKDLLYAEGNANHLCQEVFELKKMNIRCRAQMERLAEEVDEQRRIMEQAKKHGDHIRQQNYNLEDRYKDMKATNEENVTALAKIRKQLAHGPQTSLSNTDREATDTKVKRAKEQNDLLQQELEKMPTETLGSEQEAFHLKMMEEMAALRRDRHRREECLLKEVEELKAQLKKQESYNHELSAHQDHQPIREEVEKGHRGKESSC